MNTSPFFELSKNQTRVLVIGCKVEGLLYHILQFNEKKIDFISSRRTETPGSDFSILVTDDLKKGTLFAPNIVLISNTTSDSFIAELLKSIVGGGVVIYPEGDAVLSEYVDAAVNYFRKIPYPTARYESTGNTIVLETETGGLPLSFNDPKLAITLEGLRILCQQLGVMEEAFYEAVMNFTTPQQILSH